MRTRSRWFPLALATLALVAAAGVAQGSNDAVRLTARLSGAQEVPAADPDGRGKADVRIDVDAGEVCFDVKFEDIGTPNRAHIHEAPAGSNGPIVVTFFELRIPPADPGAPASDPRNDALEAKQRLEGCVSADPTLLARIVANPANFYVNLHNARYPAGAIRCELES